jgi:hypothetical protein
LCHNYSERANYFTLSKFISAILAFGIATTSANITTAFMFNPAAAIGAKFLGHI